MIPNCFLITGFISIQYKENFANSPFLCHYAMQIYDYVFEFLFLLSYSINIHIHIPLVSMILYCFKSQFLYIYDVWIKQFYS